MVTDRERPRAALWRRLWARVLDSFLAAMSTYFPTAALVVVVIVTGFEPFASSDNAFGTAWLLVCALGIVATLLIEVWMLSRFGRTPGKRASRVRVVSSVDGSTATAQQALVRSTIPLIAATIGVLAGTAVDKIMFRADMRERGMLLAVCFGTVAWLLIHTSALWDKNRRGWPDRAASTIVIQDIPRAWRRTDDETSQRWRQFLHGHDRTTETYASNEVRPQT